MRPAWWRYALQQRLGTLAAAALIMWTVATAVAAAITTTRIADGILAERQARARAIAVRLQAALVGELRQLDQIAAATVRFSDDAAVAGQVRRLRLSDSVLRVDRHGRVLWARAVADGMPHAAPIDRLPDFTADRWHVEGTTLVHTPQGWRAFLVFPARESDPEGGALAAAIDPQTTSLRAVLATYREEPYRVELVGSDGREILSSRAPVRNGRPLAASTPLPDGQWEVRLTQPRDEALGPVLTLRSILVGSSLLLLPFAVVVAVATARSIRQPVLAITATAERLARGEFAAPVPAAGEDEIGRLALALEKLRVALAGDERRAILLKRVIAVQEEERRRIARELHDQTTQQLTALAMQLQSLAAAQPDAGALRRADEIVRAAIDDLHRVIHDLRPAMLDDLGLLPAIGSYAETHLRPAGIEVHCEFPDELPPLPREARTALYRVAQEALTNVARHARAETVLIGCTVADNQIVLEIEDDGIGFAPERLAQPKATGEGLGLLGMRERLALLGGSLTIESEPGCGTRVVAQMPLTTAEAAA